MRFCLFSKTFIFLGVFKAKCTFKWKIWIWNNLINEIKKNSLLFGWFALISWIFEQILTSQWSNFFCCSYNWCSNVTCDWKLINLKELVLRLKWNKYNKHELNIWCCSLVLQKKNSNWIDIIFTSFSLPLLYEYQIGITNCLSNQKYMQSDFKELSCGIVCSVLNHFPFVLQ